MRHVFLASFAATLALSASAARADEVTYPVQDKVYATQIDSEPIVTSDVTYLGAHAVVVKDGPGPGPGFVAAWEDVQYAAEALPLKAAPGRPSISPQRLAKHDCGCDHG